MSSGIQSSILTQVASLTTVYGEKVPQQHMMPRSLPLVAWWRAVKSVTWRPASRNAPRLAEVLHAAGAVGATTAGRDEAEHDMVAGLHGGDAGTDLDDLAGTLVTADDRELLEAHQGGDLGIEDHVAGDEVLVGVTETGRRELDLDLTGLRIVQLDVFDAPVLALLPENRCLCLHWVLPSPVRLTDGGVAPTLC